MNLFRSMIASLLFLIFFSCGEEQKESQFENNSVSEKTLATSVANKEVKEAFDKEFCKYKDKGALRLNKCNSIKEAKLKSGNCRSKSLAPVTAEFRQQVIDNLRDFYYKPDKLEIDIINDVAIVKFDAVLESKIEAKSVQLPSSGTMEFVRKNGEWQMIHEHLIADTYKK